MLDMETPLAHQPAAPVTTPRMGPLLLRSAFGGTLMGLANLVPGISGGTMLLAVGIYPRFIAAISEVTTLRFRKHSIWTLACVGGAAALAIVSLAGLVKDLVVEHRWITYAVFIGLTLGGVPLVWRLIGSPRTRGAWVGAAAGFVGMALVALAQMQGGGAANREGFGFLLLAGIAGASAMILPGISGSYLLLLLGAYVPILAGIDAFKEAARGAQVDALLQVGLRVILPVAIGVSVGIVAVSHVLRWLLERFRQPTLGVLLGLLLGAVLGLWPFQQAVAPAPGAVIKGQTVQLDEAGRLTLSASGRAVEREDYPTVTFRPTLGQVGAALGLVVAGFLVTLVVDRLGREDGESPRAG
jgi:putative membrane protein